MADTPVKTVLFGVGGWGGTYIDAMTQFASGEALQLVGVVDPYAGNSRHDAWLKQNSIPVYDTPEDFFRENNAELTLIATPVPLHRKGCESALAHGSHVLCEKPLVPSLADWEALRDARRRGGRMLAVGFQWSFSHTILRLKQAILDGRFGKPLLLKTLLMWPRGADYYTHSTWKGRVRDNKNGLTANDSVVSNATAHYLHNIFFLLGDTLSSAACPSTFDAKLYRTKDIETFDTCIMTGHFAAGGAAGATFCYAGSHAGTEDLPPIFTYTFEQAEIGFNDRVRDGQLHVRYPDGRDDVFGNPDSAEKGFEKLRTMQAFIRHGAAIPCDIDTVYPHTFVCDALHNGTNIQPLPDAGAVDEMIRSAFEDARG